MELILKNVDPKDYPLVVNLAKRLGIHVETSANEEEYDPEFVAKILESKKQAEEGKATVISVDDLWK